MTNTQAAKPKLRKTNVSKNKRDREGLDELEFHQKLATRPEIASVHILQELLIDARKALTQAQAKLKERKRQHSFHQVTEQHYRFQVEDLQKYVELTDKRIQGLENDIRVQRKVLTNEGWLNATPNHSSGFES